MTQKILADLTDTELLQAMKRAKSTYLIDAIFFGVLIGIAIYSTVNHGLGLLTFIPLVYIPVATKNTANKKKLEKLVLERNLNIKK